MNRTNRTNTSDETNETVPSVPSVPSVPFDQIQQVADRIRAGKRFLITSHRNPDGDAIGSSLALQGILRKLGKEATVIVRDTFGKPLQNIPGSEGVIIADSLPSGYPREFDALFTMECPEEHRCGYSITPGPVINIDHHVGNTMYGEVNYLDLEAPSVGEMIWQLNKVLGVPLDEKIATAMYVSLAADTGFFRFSNTTQRAFEAGVEMVRAGANPAEISLWLNESNSRASIKLLGLCLSTLDVLADGKIATIELPRRFYEEAGALPEDAEGVVNYGRTIETVLVSVLFKELDSKTTRVSMRAKPGIDTQQVAAMFGGGGHKAASGCTIQLPMQDAKEKLLSILKGIV